MSRRQRRLRLFLPAVLLLAGCGGSGDPATGIAPTSDSGPAASSAGAAAVGGVVADAEVIKQLAYASASGRQVLHLSLPVRTGSRVPVVVLVHGGGFETGGKGDVRFLVEVLNAAGYATAAIDYRLSGEALFPAAVQDVKAAIRLVRSIAPVHGIDPDQIAVWGLSAGGHLAAMAGVSGDQRTVLDGESSSDSSASSSVQAVVAWYAPTDFAAMDRQAIDPGGCPGVPDLHDPADSPESRWLGGALDDVPEVVRSATPAQYLDAASVVPPFYLAHGDRDCTVPYGQTLEFADALRSAGADVSVDIVTGAGHAERPFDQAQIEPSISFLDRVFHRPTG